MDPEPMPRLLFLATLLMLVGCQPGMDGAPPPPDTGEAHGGEPLDAATDLPPGGTVNWSGTYGFKEATDDTTWTYRLALTPDDDVWSGSLTIDGGETHARYDLRGDPDEERLSVVLAGYGPDNRVEEPFIGTVLFTLRAASDSSAVLTQWDGLEPKLPDTPRTGVAFTRDR